MKLNQLVLVLNTLRRHHVRHLLFAIDFLHLLPHDHQVFESRPFLSIREDSTDVLGGVELVQKALYLGTLAHRHLAGRHFRTRKFFGVGRKAPLWSPKRPRVLTGHFFGI